MPVEPEQPEDVVDASADEDLVEVSVDEAEDDEENLLLPPGGVRIAKPVEHYRWRLSKTLTRRLDQYLVDRVGHLSRQEVQRLIRDSKVRVNGKPAKASYKPQLDDVVEMDAPGSKVAELAPEPIPLDIVYEDEHFLALNKQADLIVHPARGNWSGTLVNGLVHYGKKWSQVNGNWRPGILHRLDRHTTGIMLVAKSDEAHWRLARQFELRTIQKTYLGICHGVPELLEDVIDLPIGRDRHVREKMAVRKPEHGAKEAQTRYEVQEIVRVPADARVDGEVVSMRQGDHPHDRHYPTPPQDVALVKLLPKTGRTHQLRVHMAAIGHPLVGDVMYGGRALCCGDFTFARQALHAFEIRFTHPGTLQEMTLAAPIPIDMRVLLQTLKTAKGPGQPPSPHAPA